MEIAAQKTADLDYKVADLSLAEWGRQEIILAEQEMPGLMACAPSTGTPSRSRVRESLARYT